MCHITMFQVTVASELAVLDFQVDKLAPGQSLVILLALVCVLMSVLLIDLM